MFKAKLVVVGGEANQTEVELKLPMLIGRGRDAGLTVPHALVSRRHCEIFDRDGRLVVRDLGSLNGTFINNKRIEGEQLLDPEQLLTLGTVTFRAIYTIGAGASPTDVELDPLASVPQPSPQVRNNNVPELLSLHQETIDIDSIRPADSEPAESENESRPLIDLELEESSAGNSDSDFGSFLSERG